MTDRYVSYERNKNDSKANELNYRDIKNEKDLSWRYEKFKGNAVAYEICPKCNSYYSCGGLGKAVITCNYCPNCGSNEIQFLF